MDDIKRGEIFYISRGGASYGSEQQADRPAVVVSNDSNNEHSGVVEVVYLTTQPKTDLPTHVTIRSTGRISTALCEQIVSISTDRVNKYIGQCSDKEMENIDIALMISLSLDAGIKTTKKYQEDSKRQQDEIERLREELAQVKTELTYAEENETDISEQATTQQSRDVTDTIIRIETERDTFKIMYESLLAKVMAS